MKKQWICLNLCAFLLLSLIACQGTPEEAVVVDKSKGISEEYIIPADNKTPKDLEVPEHWKETITRSDGFVTIEADYEVELLDVYNTPIYGYTPAPLSKERLGKLCTYFANGNKLYEVPAMTKSELEEEKVKIENRVGRWGRYLNDFSSMAIINEKMERMEEARENAPLDKVEKKYIEPGFMIPYKTEEEFVRDWGMRSIYEYGVNTDKQIGFAARVDKGQDIDPLIRAINYDSQVGSSTHFLYQQGMWMDENELEESLENWKDKSNRVKEYLQPLKEAMDREEKEFTKDEAINIAKKAITDLNIKNMDIFECVKAVGIFESESWAGFDELDKGLISGYAVTIYPKCEDLFGIAIRREVYDNMPEEIYVPPYFTQKIYMIITEDGIQRFEWTDIAERSETIAENTKILTFEEIKEKLADHLLYETIAFMGEEAKELGDTMIYDVENIELRSMFCNAFENPEAAWLVPVWVFDLGRTASYENGEYVNDLGKTTVILNAIDGGYVSAP